MATTKRKRFQRKFGEDLASEESEDSDYEPSDSSEGAPVTVKKQKFSTPTKSATNPKTQTPARNKRQAPTSSDKKRSRNANKATGSKKREGVELKSTTTAANQQNETDITTKSSTLVLNEENNKTENEGPSLLYLPHELQVLIFQKAVEGVGAVPLLYRLMRTCRAFKRLIDSNPQLWTHAKIRPGMEETWSRRRGGSKKKAKNSKKLTWEGHLTKAMVGRWQQMQSISVAGVSGVTDTWVEALVGACPLLQQVDFSDTKLTSRSLPPLHNLPHLSGVKLTGLSLNPAILRNFISTVGPQLTLLVMARCRIFPGIMDVITQHCPHLRHLDLRATTHRHFDIKTLQVGCRKLRHLALSGMVVERFTDISTGGQGEEAQAVGFPDLCILRVAAIEALGGEIVAMSRMASRVEVLDLDQCKKVHAEHLEALPCIAVRKLYLSASGCATVDGVQVFATRWGATLTVLDISWSNHVDDEALAWVSRHCHQLQVLNASGTAISAAGVKNVLLNCSQLKDLDLTSCRGLPRGIKRHYSGQEIQELRLNDALGSGHAE